MKQCHKQVEKTWIRENSVSIFAKICRLLSYLIIGLPIKFFVNMSSKGNRMRTVVSYVGRIGRSFWKLEIIIDHKKNKNNDSPKMGGGRGLWPTEAFQRVNDYFILHLTSVCSSTRHNNGAKNTIFNLPLTEAYSFSIPAPSSLLTLHPCWHTGLLLLA